MGLNKDCKPGERKPQRGRKYGQSQPNDLNKHLQFLSLLNSFNAAPGAGAAMRSAAARLSIMTNEERRELKMEIRECLGPIGLNLKTLHKMKKLDNLVCEVCAIFPST